MQGEEIRARKRTEEVVEQLAAVFVGMEAVVDVRRETGVDMTVVEFTVEDKEDLIFYGA